MQAPTVAWLLHSLFKKLVFTPIASAIHRDHLVLPLMLNDQRYNLFGLEIKSFLLTLQTGSAETYVEGFIQNFFLLRGGGGGNYIIV